MKNILLAAAFVAAATVTSLACSSKSSGGSTSGASDAQVSQCKSGCDQAKFFQCSDTNSLSICYDDCGTASPGAIDKFNACSNTSICDPSCRGLIDPPPASGGGGSSGGGGVAASDCNSACNKLISQCNLAPVGELNDCISQCQSQGYQYQIDCINNNACADLQSRCGGGSSGGGGGDIDSGINTDPNVFECTSTCDQLHSRDCLSASEYSTCTSDCSSITGTPRSTFNSCVQSADGSDCTAAHDCYSAFAN